MIDGAVTEIVVGVGGCNRRQVEMEPATLFQQMAGQVIDMEPLHDDDDRILALVVESRGKGVAEPVFQRCAHLRRHRISRLLWIVDYDQRSTSSGERTPI